MKEQVRRLRRWYVGIESAAYSCARDVVVARASVRRRHDRSLCRCLEYLRAFLVCPLATSSTTNYGTMSSPARKHAML